MSEAVIVALITGACAVIAQLIISKQSAKDLYAELDKRSEVSDQKLDGKIEVIETKINDLTREVRQHNGHAERIATLETKVSSLERRAS